MGARQGARYEAAYTEIYRGRDDKEIGVWALLLKEGFDHQSADRRTMISGQRHRIIKDSVIIVAWTESEDLECFEAVRSLLEEVH